MSAGKLIEDELTNSVIGAFYDVYNELRFGFLEHVYIAALERELLTRNHAVGREVGARVYFKGEDLCSYRMDMVVDEKLIIEVKSTTTLHPSAVRQVDNYLRATTFEVGLLLHFGPEPQYYRRVFTNVKKRFCVVPLDDPP